MKDEEPFDIQMARLTTTLREQMAEEVRLDREVAQQLARLGL